MSIDYLRNKPDGIIGYQTLLYGTGGKEIVGNAFMTDKLAVYIMYDYKGKYLGEKIEIQE